MFGIVNLNLGIEKIILVDRFTVNEVFRPKKVILLPGGKGVNIARVFKLFGDKYELIGFLGGDTGEFIKKELENEKINFIPIKIDAESRICNVIIDTINHTNTVINEKGPKISKNEVNRLIKRYENFIVNKKIVILTGSLPLNVPDDIYAILIEIAKGKNIPVFLDTSGNPLIKGIKSAPMMIKPNTNELKFILNKKTITITEMKNIIKRFVKEYCIKIPIITMGKNGAITYSDKKIYIAKSPEIKVINAVGSGDTFIAGFLHKLFETNDIKEALRFGVACGTANALTLIPGYIKKSDIKKQFLNIEIKQELY